MIYFPSYVFYLVVSYIEICSLWYPFQVSKNQQTKMWYTPPFLYWNTPTKKICTTINTANKFNKELFFKIYIFCSHQFINKIKLFGICAKSDRKINPNKLELLSFILNLPLTLDISLGFLSDFPKMMTTFRILFNSKEPGLC